MKKIIYLVCASVLVWGCTQDPRELNVGEFQENSLFALDEAKAFFEEHMSSTLAIGATSGKNGFIPGDFTVDWDNAVCSSEQAQCNLEFAIDAKYRFRVLRSEYVNGTVTAYSVPVYQKLVIVKNVKSDKMSNYIMTFIPDRRYDQTHRNFDPQSFSVYGDHARFSGLIVYSTLENTSRPVQVCIFSDGIKRKNYSIFKTETDLKTIVGILSGMEVTRKANVATRSGEDDEGDSGWDEEPFVGADGMTTEEWMDKTNPGLGAEPEIVLPEDDYEGCGTIDPVIIVVRHKPCGRILGYFTIDEIEERPAPIKLYCSKCKVYVWI